MFKNMQSFAKGYFDMHIVTMQTNDVYDIFEKDHTTQKIMHFDLMCHEHKTCIQWCTIISSISPHRSRSMFTTRGMCYTIT